MTTAFVPNEKEIFLIEVSIAAQRLRVLRGEEVVAEFPVSTSRFGLGSEPGSFKTPLGNFRIAEKIGAKAPAWSVFRARQPTGEIASEGGEEDLVLTRILWLEGLEEHNANTRDRFIYLHGTNQEKAIGTPASHGCVRLANADMIRLYEMVPVGTPLRISAV